MRRSEMIARIVGEMVNYDGPYCKCCRDDYAIAEYALKAVEDVGMLPPCTDEEPKRHNHFEGNCFYWEPESEE